MMGKLGFDIVVSELKENDLKFCQDAVKGYDGLKQVIWQGDQYRLVNPHEQNMAALMYVDAAKSTAVMFNYLVNYRYGESSKAPIRLKGLDPNKKYKLEEINLYPGTQSTLKKDVVFSGDFLMNIGFNPEVNTGRTSVIVKIKEI